MNHQFGAFKVCCGITWVDVNPVEESCWDRPNFDVAIIASFGSFDELNRSNGMLLGGYLGGDVYGIGIMLWK